jgi:hypothetical protein
MRDPRGPTYERIGEVLDTIADRVCRQDFWNDVDGHQQECLARCVAALRTAAHYARLTFAPRTPDLPPNPARCDGRAVACKER